MKKIVTITGPTCSGKTTLINLMTGSDKFTEIISTTTRPQRPNEVNGSTYYYVSEDEFEAIEMLESVSFNGNRYGSSVEEIERRFSSGMIPAIVVEPHGMKQINENAYAHGWRVFNIFIGCPIALQSERFIGRVVEEYNRLENAAPDDPAWGKFTTEYVSRLVSIQTDEKKWPEKFRSAMTGDHLVITDFTEENQERVLKMVNEFIDNMRGR